MRFSISFVVLAATALLVQTSPALGAHYAVCTKNTNGSGGINYQVTKDCCAATKEHSTTHFDEANWRCEDALGLGNGINLGRFVRCCGSRGAGSQGA